MNVFFFSFTYNYNSIVVQSDDAVRSNEKKNQWNQQNETGIIILNVITMISILSPYDGFNILIIILSYSYYSWQETYF